jgi:16S rRNA (adenine1518-N6/adenine1519-N6)-dimethyltransferase
MSALSPTQTQLLLNKLQHNPKKKLGQNFLIDGNIVRKSIDLAQIKESDTVIEIGPGLGTLTRGILKTGAQVYAVERDATLAEHLRKTLCTEFPKKLSLIEGDALDHPLAGFSNHKESNYKIVANLPYAISTPWLSQVLNQDTLPTRMVVMLQKEAADRYMAKPNTKHFSPVTIAIQSAYTEEPGHAVSRTCFHPIPSVDSALLHLKLKENPYLFHKKSQLVMRFVFSQRRKQIKKLCSQYGDHSGPLEDWLLCLNKNGYPTSTRAEAIPIGLWQSLDQLIRSALSGSV